MSSNSSKIAKTITQTKKYVERLDELETWKVEMEQFKVNLVQNLSTTLTDLTNRTSQSETVLSGMVRMLDAKKVQEAVDADFADKVTAEKTVELAKWDQALKEGFISPVDVASAENMIVITETDERQRAIGTKGHPFTALKPEFQAAFLGKPAGTAVPTPNGGTVTLDAIYKIDEEKTKTILAEQAAAKAAGDAAAAQVAAAASQAPTTPVTTVLTSVPADATTAAGQ